MLKSAQHHELLAFQSPIVLLQSGHINISLILYKLNKINESFNPLSYYYSRVIDQYKTVCKLDNPLFQSPIVLLQSGHMFMDGPRIMLDGSFNPLSYYYSRVINEGFEYGRAALSFQSPIVLLQSGHLVKKQTHSTQWVSIPYRITTVGSLWT